MGKKPREGWAMFQNKTAWVVCSVCLLAGAVEARSINKIKVSEGYDDTNTLRSPVVEAASIAPLTIGEFGESFDRAERVFERRSGFMRGGVKAKLGENVRPGPLLSGLLGNEAERMGFRVGPDGWRIGGTITSLSLENDLPSAWAMGALLFYGRLGLDLELTSPAGERFEHTLLLHSYSVQGGMSGFKSARDAMATQLIEGAQEVLSMLNRLHFGAPPHPSVQGMIAKVKAEGVKNQEPLLHAIGLSGSREAVPAILELLEREKNENFRSHLINALARIASPDAVPVLTRRYPKEDDDCRWYTLKAMDYIGTDEALALVREHGLKDSEKYYQTVAGRILGQE